MRGIRTLLACSLALVVASSLATAGRVEAGPAAADRRARPASSSGSDDLLQLYPPPRVTAAGWLVADGRTGRHVAGSEAATPRPIASLAKLMTALLVLEDVELDETVAIPRSVEALPADAATMQARPGERWKAADLLRAMLAHSANDAAIALALHAGSGNLGAFVERMNERAGELGLDDTEFQSPSGLDAPGAVSTSTPADLVVLARELMSHPEARAAMAERTVRLTRPGGGSVVLANRNPLLGRYDGVDGVKTGFTDAARYMLVSHHVDTATRGELLVATFGSTAERTRIADQRALLDWARPLRTRVLLVEAGMPVAAVPISGDDARLPLFACDDLHATVRVGDRIVPVVAVPRSVPAPVEAGDVIGSLRFEPAPADTTSEANDEVIARIPLCAGADAPRRTRLDQVGDLAGDWRAAARAGASQVAALWGSIEELAS